MHWHVVLNEVKVVSAYDRFSWLDSRKDFGTAIFKLLDLNVSSLSNAIHGDEYIPLSAQPTDNVQWYCPSETWFRVQLHFNEKSRFDPVIRIWNAQSHIDAARRHIYPIIDEMHLGIV